MTTQRDYEARLNGVRALMHAHGLDFLVVGPSADMVYLTGAHRGRARGWRHLYCRSSARGTCYACL